MRRASAIVAAAVAAVAAWSGTSGASAPSTVEPLRIGMLVCQSGSIAASFAPAADAAKAWAEATNAAGGVNGRPVELNLADDGCDPATALAEVRDLVESKEVALIVAATVTESAWADYLDEQQVPAISGASNPNATWTEHPMLFPVIATTPDNTAAQIHAAVDSGASRGKVIYCAEAPACRAAADFWEQTAPGLGIEMASSVQVAASAPNFTAECIGARDEDVDHVYVAVPATIGVRIVSDCLSQGYEPTYNLSGSALATEYLSVPGIRTIGSQNAFPWFLEDPSLDAFHDAIETYGDPEAVGAASSATWTGLTLVAKVGAALPDGATSDDVLQQLWAIEDETLDGLAPQPLTFTEGAAGNGPLSCYYLAGIEGGEFVAPRGLDPQCP